MINLSKMLAALDVFRKGESVAEAAKAKNRAALVGALAGLLYAAAELAKEFGYDLGISPETAQHVALFVMAIAGLFVTFATSDKVGLPAKPPVPPDAGSDPSTQDDLRGGP